MKIGLLGKKIGMTRVFKEDGQALAVTVLEVQPSVVTAIKNEKRDGYCALQLGYGERKEKHTTKPLQGFFKKLKLSYKKVLYETPYDNSCEGLKPGDMIGIDNFSAGDFVDVTGTSIGKGFQGVMKRHNFHGGRASHGDATGRRPGSIGQSSFPSRVFKGVCMPGRMGGERTTIQNLEVVDVDLENNLLLIKGGVPGPEDKLVKVAISLKEGTDKELKITSEDAKKEEVVEEKKEDSQPAAEETPQDAAVEETPSEEAKTEAEETKPEEEQSK